MSETTPEPEGPAAAPPPPPQTAPSQSAPTLIQPPVAPGRPVNPKPVYRRRSFQLTAVGVVGLLLGCLIGLGIGLVSGLVAGHHHGRDDIGRHHQWGPGDGYRQPNRKLPPGGPFAPQRPQQVDPGSPSSIPLSPSPS